MDYIQQWQQNLKQASQEGNLRRLIDVEIYRLAPQIIALNIAQIEAHQGFDDKPMVNDIRIRSGKRKGELAFPGTYSEKTQEFSGGVKTKGDPYDFNWHGDFLGNFNIKAVGKGFSTYSTGTGSGDKQEFFEGYKNMFGLDTENTATIENEVLYYVLEKSLNQIYG